MTIARLPELQRYAYVAAQRRFERLGPTSQAVLGNMAKLMSLEARLGHLPRESPLTPEEALQGVSNLFVGMLLSGFHRLKFPGIAGKDYAIAVEMNGKSYQPFVDNLGNWFSEQSKDMARYGDDVVLALTGSTVQEWHHRVGTPSRYSLGDFIGPDKRLRMTEEEQRKTIGGMLSEPMKLEAVLSYFGRTLIDRQAGYIPDSRTADVLGRIAHRNAQLVR